MSASAAPNALWCADLKGEFKLGNGRYCYPLTVTDQASRFVLLCEALESTREEMAITAFEQLFAGRGLPQVNRAGFVGGSYVRRFVACAHSRTSPSAWAFCTAGPICSPMPAASSPRWHSGHRPS